MNIDISILAQWIDEATLEFWEATKKSIIQQWTGLSTERLKGPKEALLKLVSGKPIGLEVLYLYDNPTSAAELEHQKEVYRQLLKQRPCPIKDEATEPVSTEALIMVLRGNNMLHAKSVPCLQVQRFEDADPSFWENIRLQTGLDFQPYRRGMRAQPESLVQVLQLVLILGGVKIRSYDNPEWPNTLMIKTDHHNGYHIDSICYHCAEHHGISTRGMTPNDRLAC